MVISNYDLQKNFINFDKCQFNQIQTKNSEMTKKRDN